ncbi:MAG: MFS transporter [Candidatus Eremiobacteraeota bacterium]|nr:MFS transporter [Candidatus Eremiobacteraeota bacterium]
MATWFSASAVVVPIASAFNIAGGERGWITAAVQCGFVTAAVASAAIALADWLEPRTLMRIGMMLAAAANAAILVVHTPPLLFVLRFLTGAGLAFVYPPSVRLLTAWFPHRRGIVTGIAVGALTIGSFSPHLFSGDLPWRGVVLVSSVSALLSVPLISIVTLPPAYARAGRFDVRALGAILSNRNVMLADAGYWGHMWELYAVWAWGPVFYAASLQAAHVRGPAGILIFLFFGIMGAAGCVVAGILGDRFGRAQVAGAAMAVSGTISFAVGYAFGANPWLVSVLFAVWGFAVVADSAQFSAAVTEFAEPQYAGTALTFQMGVGFLITMLTIWSIGALQPVLGWGRAFMILSAGPAAGVYAMSVLYLRLARAQGRQQLR